MTVDALRRDEDMGVAEQRQLRGPQLLAAMRALADASRKRDQHKRVEFGHLHLQTPTPSVLRAGTYPRANLAYMTVVLRVVGSHKTRAPGAIQEPSCLEHDEGDTALLRLCPKLAEELPDLKSKDQHIGFTQQLSSSA